MSDFFSSYLSPLLFCRTSPALSPATAASWIGLTVNTWWPHSHTSISPVSSGECSAGGLQVERHNVVVFFFFSNKVIRGDCMISAMLSIFAHRLAGDLTRASCCNSCWCFSLNSSSAFSTRCSITWERGTYCPLLLSDRCRLRSGWWLCMAMPWELKVSMCKHTGAHTHTRTLGKVRCVNLGLPQRFHYHPAGCLFDFEPLKWPWSWRDDME